MAPHWPLFAQWLWELGGGRVRGAGRGGRERGWGRCVLLSGQESYSPGCCMERGLGAQLVEASQASAGHPSEEALEVTWPSSHLTDTMRDPG